MALDLKKLATRRSGIDQDDDRPRQPASARPAKAGNPEWHGKDSAPPPPGSSWDAFVDWASGEAFEPWPEDIALAWKLWTGRSEPDADQPSPPGP